MSELRKGQLGSRAPTGNLRRASESWHSGEPEGPETGHLLTETPSGGRGESLAERLRLIGSDGER